MLVTKNNNEKVTSDEKGTIDLDNNYETKVKEQIRALFQNNSSNVYPVHLNSEQLLKMIATLKKRKDHSDSDPSLLNIIWSDANIIPHLLSGMTGNNGNGNGNLMNMNSSLCCFMMLNNMNSGGGGDDGTGILIIGGAVIVGVLIIAIPVLFVGALSAYLISSCALPMLYSASSFNRLLALNNSTMDILKRLYCLKSNDIDLQRDSFNEIMKVLYSELNSQDHSSKINIGNNSGIRCLSRTSLALLHAPLIPTFYASLFAASLTALTGISLFTGKIFYDSYGPDGSNELPPLGLGMLLPILLLLATTFGSLTAGCLSALGCCYSSTRLINRIIEDYTIENSFRELIDVKDDPNFEELEDISENTFGDKKRKIDFPSLQHGLFSQNRNRNNENNEKKPLLQSYENQNTDYRL